MAMRPRTILVAGWCAFVLYAYPGQLTQDSLDQLKEARDGFYTDAHPPLLQLLWRLADAVIAGPLGMLVLQSAAFVIGAYLVLGRALAPRRAAACTVGLLLFPPVATVMAAIWKDSMMAGLGLLAIGLVLDARRARQLAGLALVGFAFALRYNGPAAALPLVVLLFAWRAGVRGPRRYAVAVAAWLAITAVGFAANMLLVDRKVYFWHSTLAVMDIVGTVRFAPPLDDATLRAELAGTELLIDHDIQATMTELYSPRNFGRLIKPPTAIWHLPFEEGDPIAPEAQRDAIARAWWRLVSAHPRAYLRHRLHVFRNAIGVHGAPMGAVPRRHPRAEEQFTALGLPFGASQLQDALTAGGRWLADATPLFTQWLYVVLAIVLVPFARRERDVLALLLSGLALDASLFLLAASPDYRYSHWLITCTLIAIAMLIARRYRGSLSAAGASGGGSGGGSTSLGSGVAGEPACGAGGSAPSSASPSSR